MINANYTKTQSCLGMPASHRVATAWMRALPISIGEVAMSATATGVAVQGTGASKRRFANDITLPGASAWSPPT